MSKSYHIGPHAFEADSLAAALYLVATPIGHLKDVTIRALEVLAAADTIYCEDTRVTAKLLERYGIRNSLKPYHDHNAAAAGKAIIDAIAAGRAVALCSDAGTPLLSDPGFPLVRDCLAQGLRIVALPGASALLPALQLSGLPTDQFSFFGFLPQKANERRRALEAIALHHETCVLYESPYRILECLQDVASVFPDRQISVSRELTKLHEESLRGTAAELVATLNQRTALKGEFVVVIAGRPKVQEQVSDGDLAAAITESLRSMSASKAAAHLAKRFGLSRDAIYNRILDTKDKP